MKIDLHRHMGGCIPPEIVYNILVQEGSDACLKDIKKQMQYSEGEKYDFKAFLKKFEILNKIKWTEEHIDLTIDRIVWDLISEGIDYSEIHFSVNKYLNHLNWTPEEAVEFIYERFKEKCEKWDIKIGLVLALKYEAPKELQLRHAMIINDPKVWEMVVGIDLVGDEEYFDSKFYESIFKEWSDAGKGLMTHSGESQGAKNVRESVEILGVNRIAHGIKVPEEDPDLLKICKDKGVCFDIALTANKLTGVVDPDLSNHPVKAIIEAGCDVTIGTDDPAIYQNSLDGEYNILMDTIGIDKYKVHEIVGNSIKYSFSSEIRECYDNI
jgi:adenosine deaminase